MPIESCALVDWWEESAAWEPRHPQARNLRLVGLVIKKRFRWGIHGNYLQNIETGSTKGSCDAAPTSGRAWCHAWGQLTWASTPTPTSPRCTARIALGTPTASRSCDRTPTPRSSTSTACRTAWSTARVTLCTRCSRPTSSRRARCVTTVTGPSRRTDMTPSPTSQQPHRLSSVTVTLLGWRHYIFELKEWEIF